MYRTSASSKNYGALFSHIQGGQHELYSFEISGVTISSCSIFAEHGVKARKKIKATLYKILSAARDFSMVTQSLN